MEYAVLPIFALKTNRGSLQILNRHATKHPAYQLGVSEDIGTRRTMEDAHSFVVDFDGIRGQGFFAVFDGHAGKDAAEWCGNHFHEVRDDSSLVLIASLIRKSVPIRCPQTIL